MADGPAAIAEANQLAWTRHKGSLPGHLVFVEPFAFWTIGQRPAGLLAVSPLLMSAEPEEFSDQLERILISYQDAGRPANWTFGPSAAPSDLGRLLRKRGMMGPRYLPGMNLELAGARLDTPPWPVEITTDWAEFDSAIHPLADFFPKAARRDVVPLLREAVDAAPDQTIPLLTRIEGSAAACATLFLHEGTAGLYDIVTLPRYRGMGAATAVVRAALRLASDRGAHTATLQSYPKAAGLYEKHGFQTVCRFTCLYYSRTRSAADKLGRS